MTHNHGDPLYPQAIMDHPEMLASFQRHAEVRKATRWERLVLAWRRLVSRVRH